MKTHSFTGRQVAGLLIAGLALCATPAFAVTSYYVEGGNPACSDGGAGSEAQPYCTITAAVNARKGPGIEILVKPGTYREQVTVPASGASGNPFIIRALGGPAVVDGADSFSSPGSWTLLSGNVWVAAAVTVAPDQVFMDGQRLTRSIAGPASLPAGSFRHVAGQGLYVNAGGGNPGAHELLVGRRAYGFRVDKRSFVRIEGFSVLRHEDRGIYLTGPLASTELRNNVASLSDRNGIAAVNCSLLVIAGNTTANHADHGIYLETVSQSTIEGNESYGNARPPATPVANGLYLLTSRQNLVQRNRLHHNQDSGLHFQSGVANVAVQNLLYANGDRGADHYASTGTVHVGEVSFGNTKDGLAFQSGSTGSSLHDCIASDNGLSAGAFDLMVDASSVAGLTSDYNVFWNSTSQAPIQRGSVAYALISDFTTATGLDAHSTQANPRFAGAGSGDFAVLDGSPAIDAGTSAPAAWPATDFTGRVRFDDPATPNTGAGAVPYADRGAFEFKRNLAPVAVLDATPRTGIPPLVVTATGAGSTDSDGTIASYRFDFGDGTVVGPQASPTASHTFAAGDFTVILTVTDNGGATDTASVLVSAAPNLSTNPSFEANLIRWNAVVGTLARVPGGFDGSWSAELTGSALIRSFGLNDSPNVVSPTAGPGTRYRYSAWVRSNAHVGKARLQVREYLGTALHGTTLSAPVTLSPTWQPVTVDYVVTQSGSTLDFQVLDFPVVAGEVFQTDMITVRAIALDSPPIVAAPDTVTAYEGQTFSFGVSAADPDSEVVTSLTASLAGLPAGHDAVFAVAPGNRNGTLIWTPGSDDAGLYAVPFTAANGLSGSATTLIRVLPTDVAPVVTAPALANGFEGAPVSIAVSAADIDGDAIASLSAVLSSLPPASGATFVVAPGNTAGTFTWTPSHADSGTWQVRFIAANALADTAVTVIHVSDANRRPDLVINGASTVAEGQPLTISAEAFDADDDPITALTADLSALPAGHGAVFTVAPGNESGVLAWTPTFADSGVYSIRFVAANAQADTEVVQVRVTNVDRAPVATATPNAADLLENAPLTIAVTASDPDGDAITSLVADLAGLPVGHAAVFTPGVGNATGTLAWTPGFAHAGAYAIVFTAANALTDTASAHVTVQNVDRAPLVTGPASITAGEQDTVRVAVLADDPDGEPIASLTADLSALPAGHGAMFVVAPDHRSGTLEWVPSYFQSGGPYSVSFIATNTLSGSHGSSVVVENRDRTPSISSPASASGSEGVMVTVAVTASDPDGDDITSLTADLSGLPAGHDAVFTPGPGNTGGTLTWTPSFFSAGPYAVSFHAVAGVTVDATTSITIANMDRAPAVTASATATVDETFPLTLSVTAADLDLEAIGSLTADLTALPAGHNAVFTPSLDGTSGTLTWTPTSADGRPEPYAVTFTAANALSGSSSTAISVANLERQPVVTVTPTASVGETQQLALSVTAADLDSEPIASLTADLSGLPAGHDAVFIENVNHSSGTLTWTPGFFDAPGPYTIAFTATNSMTGTASSAVTVVNLDRVPAITANATALVSENAPLSLTVTASDVDLEAIASLTANLSGLPAGHGATFVASPDHASGTLSWTPGYSDSGVYSVSFTAQNALAASATTVITVNNVDRAPLVSAAANVSANETQLLTLPVTVSDPDGDAIVTLAADLSGLPAAHGASFVAGPGNTSGTLTWTPDGTHGRAAPYAAVFTASNALSGSATSQITVHQPPSVLAPDTVVVLENQTVTFDVSSLHPDGEAIVELSADLNALPAGNDAGFDVNPEHTVGTLTWTTTFADAGFYPVHFMGSTGLQETVTTWLWIQNVDRTPSVNAPALVSVGQGLPITVSVTASDPDGEPITSLTANLDGLPAGHGAVFTTSPNLSSGVLTWSPAPGDGPGPYDVIFTAANAISFDATTQIRIDRRPVVVAPPTATVSETGLLTLNITASDPDGESLGALTAGLAGLPAGHDAVFTPGPTFTTGTLTWTPGFDDAPGPYTIGFAATNGLEGTASTVVTVTNLDRAPVVTSPVSLAGIEGQLIQFTVTASDPDGDAITALNHDFSGLPAGHGATFVAAPDQSSGLFSWTPGPAHGPGPYVVSFQGANALSGGSSTSLTVDRHPVVVAPVTATTAENQMITVNVTASDPDGQALTTLVANLSGLPAGHDAVFVAAPDHASGTLTWTPSFAAAPGPYSVSFTAANALSGSASTSITVTNLDRAPVATVDETAVVAEGALLTVTVTASDPDGEPLTSLTPDFSNLPLGHNAQFNTSPPYTSGTLTWTPTAADGRPTPYVVSFTAANALSGSDAIAIRVDQAPEVTVVATATGTENAPFTLNLTAADPDGEPLTGLSADLSGLPAGHGAVFTPGVGFTSGTLTWTPSFAAAPGPYTVTFTATNALSGTSTTSVSVTNVDRQPVVVVAPAASAAENAPFTLAVTASDPDGEPLTALTPNLSALPLGNDAVFTPGVGFTSGTLTWTPTFDDAGPYAVSFTASNLLSGSAGSTITVANTDRAPVVTAPPTLRVAEGGLATVAITAADPDGQAITSLTADLTVLPLGHNAVFTPGVGNTAGTLTWTPTSADGRIAPYLVTFNATNAIQGSGVTAITVDQPPVVSVPATATVAENSVLSLRVDVSDPDGDAIVSLTPNLSSLPAGNNAVFTVDPGNLGGTLTWRPTFSDGGVPPYGVSFTATNFSTTTASSAITVDQRPEITVAASATVAEGALLTLNVSASDPDGQPISILSANLTGLPAGHNAVFTPSPDNSTGTLTWTPSFTASRPSPYVVTFFGANTLSGGGFTLISVTNTDQAPVVTAPVSVTAVENSPLTVTVTAADAEGDAITALTADLSALPAGHGATFTTNPSKTSGTLSWTPTAAHGGQTFPITFTASNALSGNSTTSIHVDRYPILAAAATASGAEGSPMTVTVTASDPDGEPLTALTANLSGLPAGHGATFTPGALNTTGTLSWTPSFADAGGPYTVTFTASNSLSRSASTAITIANTDRAPVVTAAGTATAAEGGLFTLSVTASDPDAQPITSLTADLAGLPLGHGAVFTPAVGNASGTLTWTPTFAHAGGPFTVTFTASNALSGAALTAVTVTNTDRVPVVTAPPTASGAETATIMVHVTALDPDGETLTSLGASLAGLPAGHNATFVADPGNASGTFSWTPTHADAAGSPYNVTFTGANAASGSSSTAITVTNVDRAPAIVAPATVSAPEGTPLALNVTAADPDGEAITTLTADLSGLPPGHGATFTANPGHTGGTLDWTPSFDAAGGPFTVTFTAANALTGFATTAITVVPTDRGPVVLAPATLTVAESQQAVITVTVADPEGDPITSLTAQLSGLPAGHNAIFTSSPDHTSGTLTWTPTFADGGGAPYTVSFTATNALGGTASTAITVNETNQPPTAVVQFTPTTGYAPLSVNADAGASFDTDGTVVSYTFDFGDGTIVGPQASPLASHVYATGLRNAFVVVADEDGGLDSAAVFVNAYQNFVTNPGFETGLTGWNAVAGSLIEWIDGGRSGLKSVRATGTATTKFGINDSPNWVTTPTLGQRYRFEAWVRSTTSAGGGQIFAREYTGGTLRGTLLTPAVTLGPDWQMISGEYTVQNAGAILDLQVLGVPTVAGETIEIDDVSIHIVPAQAPVVVSPPTASIAEGLPLTVSVTASDPDGEPITSLSANLSDLPLGHSAVFTSNGTNTAGTLTWTPTFLDARPAPYNVTFTGANGQSGLATVAITVTNLDLAPIASSPVSITAPEGQPLTVNVAASDPDGDAITSLLALLAGLPAGHGAVFTPGVGNTTGSLTWTPSFTSAGGPYLAGFRAANGLADTAFTSITITNTDRAPVVTAPATASATENQLMTLTVTASDPDGQPLTGLAADFSSLPAGNNAQFTASPDFASGTLTWTPTPANGIGPYTVTFTASNTSSGAASSALSVDHHPVMTAPASVNGAEGALVTVAVTLSDPDGHALSSLTADLAGLPAGHGATFTATPDKTSGTLSWTPGYAHSGDYTVSFTGGNTLTATRSVDLHVANTDAPPTVTAPATASGPENAPITVVVTAADIDGQPITALTANLTQLPAGHGATFTVSPDHTSGTLTWTPTYEAARALPYEVTFNATNGPTGSATTAITVNQVDRAPIVSAPATISAAEGSKFTLVVSADDPDGQPVTSFTANLGGLPPGHNATFTLSPDKGIGTLSWTPTFIDAVGPYTVSFTAGNTLSHSASTAISVVNTDRPPVVTAPPAAGGAELTPIVVNVTVADPDGAAIFGLTADLTDLPAGHNGVFTPAGDNKSGQLTWTPQAGDSLLGPFQVVFTAINASTGAATTTIMVGSQDFAPVVSAPTAVATDENVPVTVTVLAGDPNGTPITSLTASFAGLPLGHNATFTPGPGNTSGTFTWRPTYNDARVAPYTVTFTAANGKSGSVSTSFTISDVDRAPVVTAPVASSVPANNPLTVNVTAGDPDGDAITLTADLSGLPGSPTFTPGPGGATGTLTWTPGPAAVRPDPYLVHFSAANGLLGEATTAITVLAPNGPPVVTAPASVTIAENGPLTINVTVADPESDPITSLTANLSGLPAGHGAVFTPNGNKTAGTLTWTPGYNHAGGPYTVSFTATNIGTGTSSTAITVTNVDRAPVVTAPATGSGVEGTLITVNVTATDPDGEAITSLTANLSTLPGGHDGVFTPNGSNTGGTFTWTPQLADVRPAPYNVVFTAANALTGTATTALTALPDNFLPVAALTATPTSGAAGVSVFADASGSSDTGGSITSYTFDFGDGTVVGPQAGATAEHVYAAGIWTIRMIVEDNQGARDTAQATINVTLSNLVTNFGFETNTTGWAANGTVTLSRVSGAGHSGTYAMQLRGGSSATALFGTHDNPNVVATHAGVGRTYRFGAWVRSVAHHGSVRLEAREFSGTTQVGAAVLSPAKTLSTTWQYLTTDFVVTTAGTSLDLRVIDAPANQVNETWLVDDISIVLVPQGDQAPLIAASPTAIDVLRDHTVTVNVTASDPNGDAITALTADLAALPLGHNAAFVVAPDQRSGVFTWTPTPADIRPAPYVVTFSAANALTGTASSSIAVTDSMSNLVSNPGFETDLAGWAPYGSAVLARVAGGHTGDFCVQASGPSTASFGIDDLPNTVLTHAGVGRVYRFTSWIRSDNSTRAVKLRIYEMNGASQVGPTVYSPEVLLSPTWQKVTVDYTTIQAGTGISLRITDYPTVANEVFFIDDVAIQLIPLPGPFLTTAQTEDDASVARVIPVSAPRAFAADRALPMALEAGSGRFTLQLEGLDGADYEGTFPRVRLRLGARTLDAAPTDVRVGDDLDGNGFEEIGATFDVEAIQSLITGAPAGDGPVALVAEIDAETPRFRSVPVDFELAAPTLVFGASFGPNPMHGDGMLRFAITRAGAVTAELFDASGRRVRTLMSEASAKPGRFELRVDGRGDGGQRLAAGLYFYRIQAAEGRLGGRFAIVR